MRTTASRFFSLFAVVALSLVVATASAGIVSQFTFETSLPTTAGPITAEQGTGTGTGSHASGSVVYSHPAGDGSASSWSSTQWAAGDYYQFAVPTWGDTGISLDWDQTSSGTGPRDFILQYSSTGTGGPYTQFGGTMTVLGNGTSPNAAWNTSTYIAAYHFSADLSTVTALDNNPNAVFRLVDNSTVSAGGGTVGTAGTDRVDNFTVSAAVPEASAFVLGLTGLVGVVSALRMRRNAALNT
jgi:hypothetical protein